MNRSAAVGILIARATEGVDLPGTASIYCAHGSHSKPLHLHVRAVGGCFLSCRHPARTSCERIGPLIVHCSKRAGPGAKLHAIVFGNGS
jgi:hypothetical protein